ncbi:aspartate kinase [Candidatus Microgenomates bacterium]|nr:MAG: aspartate kinase [Candidatus Microgenomates bacterium]
MIIAKFGGTSVSSSKNIESIAEIVKKQIDKNPVVVVSALSGITDLLLSLTKGTKTQKKEIIEKIRTKHFDLIKNFWKDKDSSVVKEFVEKKLNEVKKVSAVDNCGKSFKDNLVSYGEIMSSYIISKAINSKGIESVPVIATEMITTDDSFGSAEFLVEETKQKVNKVLIPLIKKSIVPVVTGFIGSTKKGETTTLGRGGSDYTATIIGFCLNSSEVQIWTDVDGVYTADPRVVKNVKLIPVISFKEASELALFGAKILHPRTLKPAISSGIPVKVLNTFDIKKPGTLIVGKTVNLNPITAISSKKKITLVNIYSTNMLLKKGFFAQLFNVFAKNNISIDLVSVSEVSVSVTLDNEDNLENALMEISKFATVWTKKDLGIVTLVGEGIVSSSNIIKRIFDILDSEKVLVKMVSLGATDINISLVVKSEQVDQTVNVLHNKLLLKILKKQNISKNQKVNFNPKVVIKSLGL